MKRELLIINQTSVYLMLDICNAFVDSGRYDQVILQAGSINIRPTKPHPDLKIIKSIRYNKTNIIKRLLSWIGSFLYSYWLVAVIYRKADLLLVSNPPLNIFLPLSKKRIFSFLVYDIYPEVLVGQNICKSGSIIERLWQKRNKRVFARAQKIFTLSQSMKDVLSQYVEENKITIVQNWGHNDFLKPIPKADNQFARQHQLENKFVVLYSGNMGYTHDVDCLVDVAFLVKDNPDFHFVFIGEGAKKKMIKQKIKEYKLNNCLVLPYQDIDTYPYSLSCVDVGVISLDKNTGSLSIPSKTFSLLAVGAAILCIADKNSELSKMIIKNEVGSVFSNLEIDGISTYLQHLYSCSELLQTTKAKSRESSFLFTPDNAKTYLIWD